MAVAAVVVTAARLFDLLLGGVGAITVLCKQGGRTRSLVVDSIRGATIGFVEKFSGKGCLGSSSNSVRVGRMVSAW